MKKKFTNKAVLIAIAVLSVFSVSAKTVYVTTDGNNSNDGSTWDKAVKDLATAYSKAVAGDQIWMAGGTYAFTATINMVDAVNVYGGFEKGATSIDARVRPDAENEPWKFASETVLTIMMPATFRPIDRVDKNTPWAGAVIDGIVLKDIETTDSRVAYLSDGVTLQNSIITGCSSKTTIIYLERNGIVRNCLFEKNYKQTGDDPVALQLRGSKEIEKGNLVENCVFSENRCQSVSIYNTVGEGQVASGDNKHTVRNSKFINNREKCISFNEQAIRPIEVSYCLFEGNEAASAAATSPQGTIITGGSSGECIIANCIIRNNKNTVGADADWKNCVISLNTETTKILNSLIVNNSSSKLSVYASGGIYNTTIANNEGSIQGVRYATLMNNAIIGNTATESKKVFDMDSESGCYLVNNAINSISDIGEGGPAVEITGTIEADGTNFVAPTSFVGAATTEAQRNELIAADFSLIDNSSLIGAGYTGNFLAEYIGVTFNTLFQRDLAGAARFTDGRINIGAYEGGEPIVSLPTVEDSINNIYGVSGAVIIDIQANAEVEVYSITGALTKKMAVSAGVNQISLDQQGIYLVKVGNKAHKVFVR